ncbi:3-methyl-2-oxobutanoate hydroxymethyltransferase [Nitrosomonas marina]|uniref:3-methyl-2-oxobutanoate hydroxymethyltransferase n=1 Tax=Nitrosomonas marina TaxID=917 RepID=A0A1H8CT89_9PROT|nr:3-methyl-2-oxobutanoate hydroxymethyltransferase [Nitrosomonas marina]SEM98451.1 ketopantoate hydroxymethyltransferase [Nitrosomonas marina]
MRTSISSLQKIHQNGEKFTVLTCYDATFSHVLEACGVDVLLVGDSLGNVIQGEETTLSVTLEQIIYHTRCVARGAKKAFIMTDMPFGTAQLSPECTFDNACQIMAAGAQMVKIEGGRIMTDTIQFLTQRGIPVCAHIGLTPQSIHQLGGYKIQGNTERSASRLLSEAKSLEQSGAAMLLMELVPAPLAKKITASISIPTIGIGAGANCTAQVLVLHDMLGLYQDNKAKFVKNFMTESCNIQDAIRNYVKAVKTGQFPDKTHEYP